MKKELLIIYFIIKIFCNDIKSFGIKHNSIVYLKNKKGNIKLDDKFFDNLIDHQNNIKNNTNSIKKTKKFIFFPFKNFKSEIFIGDINIGSNQQKMKIIFDTGSADIWINSSLCTNSNCNSNKFNSKESSSFKEENLKEKILIGDGYLEGKLAKDTFKINNIILSNLDFFQISKTSKKLLHGFDGIIGLGFKKLSKNNLNTFLDNLIQSKKLQYNTFFLNYLGKNPIIEFGYKIDKKEKNNKINVIDNKYWKIEIEDIEYNGKSLNLCKNNKCYGIWDSGSSLISGPSNKIYELIKKINLNRNCSKINLIPPITFIINKKKYKLENKDFIFMKQDKIQKINKCIASLSALDIPKNNNTWILGTVFLSKFKTVFDFENKNIYILN